ncbi:MAG: hypothetical protein H0W73_01970 [Bacteroidetes bacterium]|nr:hypothetical protein [Bacteroidota bacterium]
MKFLKFSYLICLGALFLFSCKNDLNINAPYKEIPSVYAVLNPQDGMQMIRVNKVFLGEGDANQMAQVADSINYPAGELSITLERYVNGVQAWATPSGSSHTTITFRDSVIQASPGAFNTTQRVYVTNDKLYTAGQYALKIKNIKSGNEFVAKANAIDSIKTGFNGFAPFCAPYYPVTPGSVSPLDIPAFNAAYIDYSNQNVLYSPKFFPNEGAIYTMSLRFYFNDYPSGFGVDSISRYVDYNFGNQYIKDLRTIQNFKVFAFDFRGQDLFNAVGFGLSKMNLNTTIQRKMYKMQAFAYTSTQEYIDYLQFTSPSLSIAQDKPIYSNFENRTAMGIFTFRTRHSVYKEMASPFVSQFSFNQFTCKYNFLTAANFPQGCPP